MEKPETLPERQKRLYKRMPPLFQPKTKAPIPQVMTMTPNGIRGKRDTFQMEATRQESQQKLIRSALRATDWKTEHGLTIQYGIDKAVTLLNYIAGWMAEHRDGDVLGIDPFDGHRHSFLDSLKQHKTKVLRTPPTMHGRVKLYSAIPALNSPVLFLHLVRAEDTEITPILEKIRKGSVVVGSAEACARVLEKTESRGQPLYFVKDRDCIAIRIA